jgi:formylglycine-generating enzyme required for sulfatase activity
MTRFASGVLIALGLLMAGPTAGDEPTPVGAVFNDCTDCPDMVVLPAGTAEIGAGPDDIALIGPEAAAQEQPRHAVTIHSFALGRTAVTRAQFSAFTFETGYRVVGSCGGYDLKSRAFEHPGGLSWIDPGFVQSDRDPVVCISHDDAMAYVKWLTRKTRRPYRLPSEAEWEYAARAGTTGLRFWGDQEACRFANVADRSAVAAGLEDGPETAFPCDDGRIATAPAGSYASNPFGLADMLGNVAQWLADCVHPNYDGAPADGSAWSGEGGCRRILRGGAWMSGPPAIRAARRSSDPPDARGTGLGFRVARDIEPPPDRERQSP